MVAYDHDSNTIHAEPMKNLSGPELLESYTTIHKPTLRTRASTENALPRQQVPNSLAKIHDCERQTLPTRSAPPPQTKRAIQTLKNHFIAGLASVNKNFPVHLWCRLISHCLLTLNLLRPSRINPKLSAYFQLHGAFDFNRTPLAPPGKK